MTYRFRIVWGPAGEQSTDQLEVRAGSDQDAWERAWAHYREEQEGRMRAEEPHHGTLHLVGIE